MADFGGIPRLRAGRLGLQHAPGMLPRALGSNPTLFMQKSPPRGGDFHIWRTGWDSTCPAGQAASRLWAAPGSPFTTARVRIPTRDLPKRKQPPFRVTVSFWRTGWDSTSAAAEAGSRLWSAPGAPFTTARVRIPTRDLPKRKQPPFRVTVSFWQRARTLIQ